MTKKGTHSIKLRVTYDRNRRYYSLGKYLTTEQWQLLHSSKVKGNLRTLKSLLIDKENRAKDIIDRFEKNEEEFSFVRFNHLFFGNQVNPNNIDSAFQEYIKKLKEKGQTSSAMLYHCAQKSISTFLNGRKYKFNEFDDTLLSQYQKWMQKQGNSISTVGIYLRNLKTLFKKALKAQIITEEQYPFGRDKYVIPTTEIRDKGITINVIGQLYKYPACTTDEGRARDLWLFLYLANGMNIKDMCRLKHSDLTDQLIIFKRSKTENTVKQNKPVVVIVNEEIKSIIKRWGAKDDTKDGYIFPFFYDGITEVEERRISQNLTRVINNWMKKIIQKLNLKISVTTYSARHSHSNVLKNEGAPIKMIADNLGHTTTLITERHYLSQYDLETRKRYAHTLLNFKKQ